MTAALGLLATDMVYEYVSTVYQRLGHSTRRRATRVRGARGAGARPAGGGRPRADQIILQRVCDCRYLGQGYELRVDVPSGGIDHGWIEKVRADFHDIHEREYSRRFEESDIELPNVRVRGIGVMPALEMPEIEPGVGVAASEASRTRARRGSSSAAGSRRCPRATTTARR